MKYIVLISILSLTLATPIWAEWTEVTGFNDNRNYIDFKRIRKANGLIYFWQITDLLEPTEEGHLSFKTYFKADCETSRIMILSMSTYKLPMGEGDGTTFTPPAEWKHPTPDSLAQTRLKAICNLG